MWFDRSRSDLKAVHKENKQLWVDVMNHCEHMPLVTSFHAKTLDKQEVLPDESNLRAGGEKLQTWFGELETLQTDLTPKSTCLLIFTEIFWVGLWGGPHCSACLYSPFPHCHKCSYLERTCLPFPWTGNPRGPPAAGGSHLATGRGERAWECSGARGKQGWEEEGDWLASWGSKPVVYMPCSSWSLGHTC